MIEYWELFEHGADIGIRGFGDSEAAAFEQAAVALTAVITDPKGVQAQQQVVIHCQADDHEILFLDWLNALIFEMATQNLLFSRFDVRLKADALDGVAWGERIDWARHQPAVEVKGATFTELNVRQCSDDTWLAQCVVDV